MTWHFRADQAACVMRDAYNTLPPADGKWAWYAAIGAEVGKSAGAVYYWHKREGLAPKVELPTACRWCGDRMDREWARRVASRLCPKCCAEAGKLSREC